LRCVYIRSQDVERNNIQGPVKNFVLHNAFSAVSMDAVYGVSIGNVIFQLFVLFIDMANFH